MKFEVAAMIPGFANSCQYWTVPAKSIQSVPRSGMPHVCAASARFGAKPIAAQAASAMTSSLLKDPSSKVAGSAGGIEPPAAPIELFVQRTVDLGDFFRLGRLVGLRLALRPGYGLAAEVAEPEAREIEAVAPVGADLLERGEQRLALVSLLRHLLGRADVDRAVPLQPGGGRNQLPDDHVLLQPVQAVDLALDRGVGQHLRRLLEGSRSEERLRRKGGLGDAEDQRLERRLLLLRLLLLDARVLALEDDLVHELAGQEVGVACVLDAHLLQHLAHHELDVLVVDVDALRAVDLLHLLDEVQLGRRRGLQAEQEIGRAT